jgi:hypothetical protein
MHEYADRPVNVPFASGLVCKVYHNSSLSFTYFILKVPCVQLTPSLLSNLQMALFSDLQLQAVFCTAGTISPF